MPVRDSRIRRIKIFTAALGLFIVCLTVIRHTAKYGWNDQSLLMALGLLSMVAVALPAGWKLGFGQGAPGDGAQRTNTRTVKIVWLLAVTVALRLIVVLMDRFEPAP